MYTEKKNITRVEKNFQMSCEVSPFLLPFCSFFSICRSTLKLLSEQAVMWERCVGVIYFKKNSFWFRFSQLISWNCHIKSTFFSSLGWVAKFCKCFECFEVFVEIYRTSILKCFFSFIFWFLFQFFLNKFFFKILQKMEKKLIELSFLDFRYPFFFFFFQFTQKFISIDCRVGLSTKAHALKILHANEQFQHAQKNARQTYQVTKSRGRSLRLFTLPISNNTEIIKL